ncbi:MAG TPA: HD domain-containing phosphohydrolase [bacterium]|jgi:putative nucleotidyltransferase with HDIG domain|nr:HD domain-containing phosphohydrolase [bacterium]
MVANELTMQVLCMAAIMEIEDPDVYDHSLRVAGYSASMARQLKLPPLKVTAIEQAALLHDLGKITIARSVLNKPNFLTEDEYDSVKEHSIVGEQVVKKIPELAHLSPLIRSHHEWYNGCGYPDGIARGNIPLGGRIIAVADAFDAMTSHRPYRRACSCLASIGELKACSGIQFDPLVVRSFLTIIKEKHPPWLRLGIRTRTIFRLLGSPIPPISFVYPY